MKKMKIMSLLLALVIAVAVLAGCNATPSTESVYTQEEIDSLQVANETLQGSLNNLHKEFDGLQTAKNVLQSDLDVLKLESDALKKEIEALRIENGILQITIDELVVGSAEPNPSAPSASSAPAAPASSSVPATLGGASKNANATKFFANCTLVVSDWTKPAVETGQSTTNLSNMVFRDASGKVIGEITSGKVTYEGSGYEYTNQAALDAFNDYRGVARTAAQATTPSGGSSSSSQAPSGNSSSANSNSTVDTAAYAREVIRLTNAERVKTGLDELYVVEDMMSAALLRAQEYSEDTSMKHERPDGSYGMDLAGTFSERNAGAENLSWGRSSPTAAVNAWMASAGHKGTILAPDLIGIAVGCYSKNGTLYWCQLFIY